MSAKLKLLKNNDHRERDATEWLEEFMSFLQGTQPKGISMTKSHAPRLSRKKAFSIVWYLQEQLPLIPDSIEMCWSCKSLFDSNSEGLHWQAKSRHYCDSCSHEVPENYDRRLE